MTEPRAERLVEKLERGRQKTADYFNALTPEGWQVIVYPEPPWQPRNLLAHFLSAEKQLLALCLSVAAGGPGAAEGLDINRFNAAEQERLGSAPPELLHLLDDARRETIAWVSALPAAQLDRVGRHPVLGEISVENMVEAIYGHQLLHMRDLMRCLQGVV